MTSIFFNMLKFVTLVFLNDVPYKKTKNFLVKDSKHFLNENITFKLGYFTQGGAY